MRAQKSCKKNLVTGIGKSSIGSQEKELNVITRIPKPEHLDWPCKTTEVQIYCSYLSLPVQTCIQVLTQVEHIA